MGDWPQARSTIPTLDGGFVTTLSALKYGFSPNSFASTAWPSANLGIFIPFRNDRPRTVYKMSAGAGATAGSNSFDIGIFDRFGNALVRAGATVKGNSVEHIINVTDTVIPEGLFYLGMAADGTGNYIMTTVSGTNPVPLQRCKGYGIYQMASAYSGGLVDPVTYATYAQTTGVIPLVAAYFRSY